MDFPDALRLRFASDHDDRIAGNIHDDQQAQEHTQGCTVLRSSVITDAEQGRSRDPAHQVNCQGDSSQADPVCPENNKYQKGDQQENSPGRKCRSAFFRQFRQRPVGDQKQHETEHEGISEIEPVIDGKTMPRGIDKRNLKRDQKHQQHDRCADLFAGSDLSVQKIYQHQHKGQDSDKYDREIIRRIFQQGCAAEKHGKKLVQFELGPDNRPQRDQFLFSLFGDSQIGRQHKRHGQADSQNGRSRIAGKSPFQPVKNGCPSVLKIQTINQIKNQARRTEHVSDVEIRKNGKRQDQDIKELLPAVKQLFQAQNHQGQKGDPVHPGSIPGVKGSIADKGIRSGEDCLLHFPPRPAVIEQRAETQGYEKGSDEHDHMHSQHQILPEKDQEQIERARSIICVCADHPVSQGHAPGIKEIVPGKECAHQISVKPVILIRIRIAQMMIPERIHSQPLNQYNRNDQCKYGRQQVCLQAGSSNSVNSVLTACCLPPIII